MKSLFFESDIKEARYALLAGKEQESITRIYTVLQQELQGDKLDIGLYPTPMSLARFMVEIIRPELGETIYDPACGLGSFFIEAYRYLKVHYGSDTSNTFLGYDMSPRLLKIGKPWMEANGVDTSHIRERGFFEGNTFWPSLWDDGDTFKGKCVILTHPPYEKVKTQQKKKHSRLSNKPVEHYDRLFLQHCMDMLEDHLEGRCGIVVSQDFFYNPAGKLQRCKLVNTFNIRLIIRLPKKLFATVKRDVNYHSYLLYFDKKGTTSQILRCNIREDEASIPPRSRQSSIGASFKEAEDIWKRWHKQSSKEQLKLKDKEQKYAWILDAKTVGERDKDYRLIDDIPTWQPEEPLVNLDELVQQLSEQTGELHKLSQQLQKRIKEGV